MQDAFLTQAMNRHGDAVYRLALCRLQNRSDAEDVYQDTFLQLFQQKNAQSWDDEHLKAWLLRVAVNKCADTGRHRKAHGYVALEELPELSGRDCYAYIELWDAVNRLPEKPRMIFHLYYSEGYKTGEIAAILKIPASTVRVNLNRARKAIRKELDDNEDIS